ncbi:MAG: hypothetical protein AAB834_05725, partial [Patescibacteria group bacterium]
DAEDLTKRPNYQSITTVMINNVPSAPFSMSFLAPMCKENPQLSDAMKRLSSTKYGFARAVVEKEIFSRLDTPAKPALAAPGAQRPGGGSPASKPAGAAPGGAGSFLDEWLSKRQQMGGAKPGAPKPLGAASQSQRPAGPPPSTFQPQTPTPVFSSPAAEPAMPQQAPPAASQQPPVQQPVQVTPSPTPVADAPSVTTEPEPSAAPDPQAVTPIAELGATSNEDDHEHHEISVRLR